MKSKIRQLTTILLVLTLLMSGCVNVPISDQNMYDELKELGVKTKDHKIKSPTLAGILNILPGCGSFYLSRRSGHHKQILIGSINAYFWPFLIVWGIPCAIVDANRINRLEVVKYYKTDPEGIKELEKMRARTNVDVQ